MVNKDEMTRFYANDLEILSISQTSTYSESGTFFHYIGFKSNSFKGFIWSFYLFNEMINLRDFYSPYHEGSNCLAGTCNSSCSPAVKEEGIDYCISVSSSIDCNSCQYGCRKNICLDCDHCSSKSCSVDFGVVTCLSLQRKVAECSNGFKDNQENCVSCYGECDTCSTALKCTTCVKENSRPHNVIGCICNNRFYNTTALINSGSCLPCNNQCSNCTMALKCETCKSLNSSPHESVGCFCNEGFYNVTELAANQSCIQCYSTCKSCNEADKCVTCLTTNAEPSNTYGCICKSGFYNLTSLESGGSCLACNSDCKTCIEDLKCKTCQDNNSIANNDTGCTCKEGYYNTSQLNTQGSCLSCYSHCLSCSTSMKCTSCKDSNSSAHIDVGCVCNEGFFNISDLTTDGACLKCHSMCKTCNQQDLCLTCLDDNAQVTENFTCVCKIGYFNSTPLEDGGSCKQCDSSCTPCDKTFECMSCTNSLESGLSLECTCDEGFYEFLNANGSISCLPCKSNCKTCSSELVCNECLDPSSKIIEIGICSLCSENDFLNNSDCFCPSGYFTDSSTATKSCHKCPEQCKECSNITSCLSCKNEFSFLTSNCFCMDGYFLNPSTINSCKKCSENCKTCNSSEFCLSCTDPTKTPDNSGNCKCNKNFISKEKSCFCPVGFKKIASICEEFFFSMNVTVNKENKILLKFTQVPLNVTEKDFEVYINNFSFTFKVVKIKVNSFLIVLYHDEDIKKGTICQVKIKNFTVFSKDGAKLDRNSWEVELNEVIVQDDVISERVAKIKTASRSTVAVSIGISLVSNPAASWPLINTLQIINYIPLNNDPLTPNARQLLLATGDFNFLPNIMSYVFRKDSSSGVFPGALKNGIENSVFFINIGQSVLIFLVMVIVLGILKACSKLPIESLSKRTLSAYNKNKYSYFLRLWIQSYLDLLILAIIQLMSRNQDHSGENRFNLFSAGITVVITKQFLVVASIPFSLFITTVNIREIQEGNQAFIIKYGAFYDDLRKSEKKMVYLNCFFYFIRRILYALSQIFLTSVPMFQRVFNIFTSFAIFCYFVIQRPFNDKKILVLNVVSEICIMSVMSCVLALSQIGVSSGKIEISLIYIILGFIGFQSLVSLLSFIINLRNVIQKARSSGKTRSSYMIN